MNTAPAIGIDLGTTNSCVAVMRHGKIEVIANQQTGSRVTPSYVAFNEFEYFVGDAAKDQSALNPENTVFDAKRMIGRKFDDPQVHEDMKNWPFIGRDINQKPTIEVMFKGKRRLFAPEQISAFVLHRMKQIAEKHLKQEVTDAVITVPAYFNNTQRQATFDAGVIAGLNVLEIINEPMAAAIAYTYDNHDLIPMNSNNLVYDLGGGTFDVSILHMNEKYITVVATNGDTHLGGEDFDCCLVDHCAREFKRKYKVDIQNNKRALHRLRTACEKAKRFLSNTTQHEIIVDSLADGITFSMIMTRAKFDDLNLERFRKTLEPVQKALDDAKLKKSNIERVVLVGGSTRIPKIEKLLEQFFDGKKLDNTINPDEAVAYGAALRAALLKGDMSGKIFGKLLQDVTPLSLGYDLWDKDDVTYTHIVIPRNSQIPTSATVRCSNSRDYMDSTFTIRQGESRSPELNYKLGAFTFVGLPKGPRGSIHFNVTFDIDVNGILTVTASETSTGKSNCIKIENAYDSSRKGQLKKMIEDAEKIRAEEKTRQVAKQAKAVLEQDCYAIKDAVLEDGAADFSEDEKRNIVDRCDEMLRWLEENSRESREVYENRRAEVRSFSQKIFDKIKGLFSTD